MQATLLAQVPIDSLRLPRFWIFSSREGRLAEEAVASLETDKCVRPDSVLLYRIGNWSRSYFPIFNIGVRPKYHKSQ
jgi:hypothetical protein